MQFTLQCTWRWTGGSSETCRSSKNIGKIKIIYKNLCISLVLLHKWRELSPENACFVKNVTEPDWERLRSWGTHGLGSHNSRVIALELFFQCSRSTAAVVASLLAHVHTMRERTYFTTTLRVIFPVLTETTVQLPKRNSVVVVNLTPLLSSW